MRISDWSSDVCSSDLRSIRAWRATLPDAGRRGKVDALPTETTKMNDATSLAAATAAPDGAVLRVQAGRPDAPIAVEVTRGGMVESTHRVLAAGVDPDGRLVPSGGGVGRLVYGRPEGRRVGTGWGGTCSLGWSPAPY